LRVAEPDLVIGTGGYVSWPVLRAAAMMGVPTVIQEQNSYPGIATRQLAGKAARVYLGFDEGRRFLPATAPILTTGNPVRSSVATGNRTTALKRFGLDLDRRTILVLGGSQGARSVNQAVLRSLENKSLPEGYQLLWQTGKLDYEDIVAKVGAGGDCHAAFAFESDMAMVYAAADLVVARAGAITLAEIEAVGLPSLLIPYPFAAGDHQRKNARAYADQGFALVVDPDQLAGTDILADATALFADGRANQMSDRLRKTKAGKKPAVDVIAEDIIRLVASRQEAVVDR
jgi:UDP-N-acetylglucosamine--N-acetylmuramyl-(pentapeptide) pyrophosphoryl-undecaprenol N-acetylglucosamine transferase